MEAFWMWSGAVLAGAVYVLGKGLWWVITTDSRVAGLEGEVERLSGRLDADRKRAEERLFALERDRFKARVGRHPSGGVD
jgi:hypothetical protein